MATPMLRALRNHFGANSRIVGIQRPYVKQVLAGTNLVDDIVEHDPRGKERRLKGFSVIRQLKRFKLDSAVLLPNSARSALLAWCAGVPQRIGYVRYGRGPLLTEKLQPLRDGRNFRPVSAVDYYLQLAALMGASIENPHIELATTPEYDRQAKRTWEKYNLLGHPTVVLNTGGAYGAAKSWPEEYFAETANRLANAMNAKVVIACGPSEQDAAKRIEKSAKNENVVGLYEEEPSIGFTKAIVKRSSLLISTDSGPRFFGPAFDVPTLTIFGPTDPRWAEPHHPLAENIRKDMPCGPCAKRTCPLKHHACMRDLTPEFVVAAAWNLWLNSQQKAA